MIPAYIQAFHNNGFKLNDKCPRLNMLSALCCSLVSLDKCNDRITFVHCNDNRKDSDEITELSAANQSYFIKFFKVAQLWYLKSIDFREEDITF